MDLASPVVGAIAGEAVGQALLEGDEHGLLKRLEADLKSLRADIHVIAEYFNALNRPDYQKVLFVPAAGGVGIPLSRQDRRYMMLLVPVGSTSVTFKIPGAGSVAFTLNAGWNELDLPEQTEITMTSATSPVAMIYLCSNTPRGVTLVSVA